MPSSNVALGAVEHLREHPIRTLLQHGVRVTVNTDDLTIFGHSVSDEYLSLFREGVLGADALDTIRRTSLGQA
jgi:adenosine deaminase